MEDNEENEKKVEPTMIRPNSHRETTVYAKPGTLDANLFNNSLHTRKSSSCSLASSGGGTGHSGGPSFTQRLIERGVAVPSSFSTWDRVRPSEDSSSPGSFDFDSYYGMSPFITPSFSTAAEAASHFHDGALYKSLHHRYEKERNLNNNSGSRMLSDDDEEDGGIMSSPDFIKRNPSSSGKRIENKKQRAEDSDIELSEEEECNNTDKLLSTSLFLLNQRSSRRSRSPLAFPVNSNHTTPGDGIFDLFDPHSYDTLEKQEEEAPKGLSPSVERLKNFLITKPPKHQPKPLPKPPRKYLLQTPVFKVKHANTTKDKYLILFNDLLLICNPIMDENMIVGTSSTSSSRNNVKMNRYRFRPNENSLFQVKKIVQLGQLTLYISKEDYYSSTHHATQTIEIGPDGRPILPPARKIHPIMASALRKFETNANLSIQYLIDKGLLSHDPLSIANFLFKTPDLNRRQLGYYLSDLKNADVYNAFLECFRLVGLRLDEALRILLTTFRLPSNWESLEYLIERFAKKWHDANQNVIKFHEDMVVKVVVAMLFLNAECWYDATSERDVFWYARELKERQDRQAKRKMSVIDYHKSHTSPYIQTKSSSSATTSSSNNNRQSVTIEPLHYIMALRERGNNQPSLDEFLERWNYYDQYHLVPREFMEEMYKSIMEERLETGWDNKTGKRIQNSNQDEFEGGVARPKVVSPSMKQGSQDVVITVIPHRLPTKLTEGMPSDPITISIPAPDKGLQIKLRGQDLVFKPNVLDFSDSCIQTFTITGNTLGRTSLMFIKTGENAGNYVSPTLPRTRSVVVEKAFMRYTFQIGFKHIKENAGDYSSTTLEENKNNFIQKSLRGKQSEKDQVGQDTRADDEEEEEDDENDDNEEEEYEEEGGTSKINENRKSHHIVNKRYTFSVETEEEKIQWLEALKRYGGAVNEERNEENVRKSHEMSSESRVALQVLKEVLLSNETKKGTARTSNTTTINKNTNNTTTTATGTNSTANTPTITTSVTNINTNIPLNNENISPIDDTDRGRTMRLLLPKKKNIEDSSIVTTSTTANVVTKRGHEIVKLVVQNSMVPLVLSFLKNQISS